MKLTRDSFSKDKGVIGHHIIQSFKPGETTPEEAYQIGLDLCAQKLKGFEYVISTHVDQDHVHNHIIVNSVNYSNGKKFARNLNKINEFREYSDYLCISRGLSVIDNEQYKGKSMTYKEWIANKYGKSWKSAVKSDIDNAIRKSDSYNSFLLILKNEGYEVKDTKQDGTQRKWISYKAPGMQRSVRDRSLGYQYFKDNIVARIELNKQNIDSKYILSSKSKLGFSLRKLPLNFIPKTPLEGYVYSFIKPFKRALKEQQFNNNRNNAINYYFNNIKKLESTLSFIHKKRIDTELEFEALATNLNLEIYDIKAKIKDTKHNLEQLSFLIDLKVEKDYESLFEMGLSKEHLDNIENSYIVENETLERYTNKMNELKQELKEVKHYERIVKKIIDKER